jgi:hypothetical protein
VGCRAPARREELGYALAEDFPGRTHFTEGDKDKWAQKRALQYMIANPAITLRRSVIKVSDFFGLEREYAAGIQQRLFAPPRWFGVLASVVIVLLPMLGILGGHALAFGHSRYHMPLMPILGVFAVALATRGVPAVRRAAAWQRAGAAVFAALLFAIWVHQVFVVDADRIRGLVDRIVGS